VESRKAGDCSFRPSADISQQTFLVPFAKHENVREKHDSEGLIQYFPRLRETGNRVHFKSLLSFELSCKIRLLSTLQREGKSNPALSVDFTNNTYRGTMQSPTLPANVVPRYHIFCQYPAYQMTKSYTLAAYLPSRLQYNIQRICKYHISLR
jgi:hypothetical protein